jgi:PAS domain S-box-containing protein
MLEQQYKQLVADIDGIVWEADARTFRFTFVSEEAERLLGYPVAQWLAPGFWADHIHPDDHDRAIQSALDSTAARRKHDFQYRMVAADGRTVWLRDIVNVVVERGQPTKLRGVMVDITEDKAAEQEQRAHVWFLESMAEVTRAIQGASDPETMIGAVLETLLTTLDADRAWLGCQGRPEATYFRVLAKRARPEFPWTGARSDDIPMSPELASALRAVRTTHEPLLFGIGSERSLPHWAELTHVQSMMCEPVGPQGDSFYILGIQQCSRRRLWTPDEQKLFREVGLLLSDSLPSALSFGHQHENTKRLTHGEHLAEPDSRGGASAAAGAEAQLIEMTERFRLLSESSLTGIYLIQDGVFRYVNPALAKMFGYAPEEIIDTLGPTDLAHPEDKSAVAENVRRRVAGELDEIRYEIRGKHKAGSTIHVEVHGRRIEYGGRVGVIGTLIDVTERRKAEDRLRSSEARFRTLVDHATDAFFLYDETGTIVDVNHQACESLGYEREELIGMSARQLDTNFETNPEFFEQVRARLRDGKPLAFDSHHRRKDGSTFPVEMRLRPFEERGHWFSVGLARDITERKRAERALIESHSLLNGVVEGTSDAVFVKDLHGRYLMINSAGARFLGKPVEEILGKDDTTLFSAETAHTVMSLDRRIMDSGESETSEETASAAGVTRTYLSTKGVLRDAQGEVTGLVGIARDITDLKRLEDQFRQAQRMEAVGRLAGGVAHDFNNLLTVINGYSELALLQLPEGDPTSHLLGEIIKAGERASNLTRQLLAFSRKQVLEPRVVSLNTLIGDVYKMLRQLIGEDIEVSFAPEPSLHLTKVDPGQFEQALMNLAVNARDAMPGGGRLSIETRNVALGQREGAEHAELRPGRYVLVAVSDSGQGMDAATLTWIFEPFFTTKAPGKGTGLGLAMVYGFVKQSGGHVEVSSKPGQGTTFRIYLPSEESAAEPTRPSSGIHVLTRGTETILLAEDDDSVRTFSKLALRSSGYVVLEARNGTEALRIAEGHPGPIHLLVTDLVMPQMGGRRLTDSLMEARPDMRVLLMSGYTDEVALHQRTEESKFTFLQKPFSAKSLTRKVREILDAPATAGGAPSPRR